MLIPIEVLEVVVVVIVVVVIEVVVVVVVVVVVACTGCLCVLFVLVSPKIERIHASLFHFRMAQSTTPIHQYKLVSRGALSSLAGPNHLGNNCDANIVADPDHRLTNKTSGAGHNNAVVLRPR